MGLEALPIELIAQFGRHGAIGRGDLAIGRDDGVADDIVRQDFGLLGMRPGKVGCKSGGVKMGLALPRPYSRCDLMNQRFLSRSREKAVRISAASASPASSVASISWRT